MKVFFNSSFTNNNTEIVDLIRKYGAEIIFEPTKQNLFLNENSFDDAEAKKYYENVVELINISETAIFEVSSPSIEIGHELTLAMEKGKQVIALYQPGKDAFAFGSSATDRFQKVEYKIHSLETDLFSALDYASDKLSIRFTLLIPPDIVTFLNYIAEKGINRSEYIRKLIRQNMKGVKGNINPQ